MNETREVLGVWAMEPGDPNAPRNRHHRREREEWVFGHFGGVKKIPAFIWRIEFFRLPDRDPADAGYYGMTLHCYAQNEHGSRHRTWVKGYDVYGTATSAHLVHVVEPENYPLTELPPEWLLLNRPLHPLVDGVA